MNNIGRILLVWLLFGCAPIEPMCQCGMQNSLVPFGMKLGLVDPDKEIREIVDQGAREFGIKKPIFVFKDEAGQYDSSVGTCVDLLSKEGRFPEAYLIKHSPWKGMLPIDNNQFARKAPFLMNQDMADLSFPLEPSFNGYGLRHPGAEKFILYHELAHVKNGDCEFMEFRDRPFRLRKLRDGIIQFLGAGACALLAFYSNYSDKAKLMAGAGAALLSYTVRKNFYYNYELIDRKRREYMADGLACQVLLAKNERKPIVHWFLDLNVDRHYRVFGGWTDDSAENIGSTHPTNFERAILCIEALRNCGLPWTYELYEEIKKELEGDTYKEEKLLYLNELHKILLASQNRNVVPLSCQKAKYKKWYLRNVLKGSFRGSDYQQVIRWNKR